MPLATCRLKMNDEMASPRERGERLLSCWLSGATEVLDPLSCLVWSGKRDSNPRPSAWEADVRFEVQVGDQWNALIYKD